MLGAIGQDWILIFVLKLQLSLEFIRINRAVIKFWLTCNLDVHTRNKVITGNYFMGELSTTSKFTHQRNPTLAADQLAQLVERQTTVREVEGSSPRPDQHSRS